MRRTENGMTDNQECPHCPHRYHPDGPCSEQANGCVCHAEYYTEELIEEYKSRELDEDE